MSDLVMDRLSTTLGQADLWMERAETWADAYQRTAANMGDDVRKSVAAAHEAVTRAMRVVERAGERQ